VEIKRACFDFDGTLAQWPPQIQPKYSSPRFSYLYANASLPIVELARDLAKDGYELHLITGRSPENIDYLRRWMKFFGIPAKIWCRPNTVSLRCEAQAAWKGSVLRSLNASLYVGDNLKIDMKAALVSEVRFYHAPEVISEILRTGRPGIGAVHAK
jgi:hypothetical protein